MKTLTKLHKLVIQKHSELEEYSTLYNKRAEVARTELIEKNKEIFKKNPEKVDLKEIAKEVFYINGFHQADIRNLQVSFLEAHTLYNQLDGVEEFPEGVSDVAGILKNNLPNQRYVVTKGSFVEVVEGSTKKMLDDYESKNYFKIFEAQISKLFDE
jgi:hypothetical protein